jgi:hypothetical protein
MKLRKALYCLPWLFNPQLSSANPVDKFASIVGSSEMFPTPTFPGHITTATPSNGDRTTTYLTTLTYPNGGPTVIVFTKSTISAAATATAGGIVAPTSTCTIGSCIPLVYTTGFAGFTVITTTSTTRFIETTELPNGQFSMSPTTSTATLTVAYSGVPRVSDSTFLIGSTVTTTGTAVVNGVLTTFTATSLSVQTSTVALPVSDASNAGSLKSGIAEVVALAVTGVLAIFL